MADEPDPTVSVPADAPGTPPAAADAAPVTVGDPQAASTPVEAQTGPQAPADPSAAASSSTSSEPAAPPAGDETPSASAAVPVVVDNRTRRDDNDALLGSFVDVVSGEHQGRFGAYVADIENDASTGYPALVLVRTRDADNLLIEVLYQDIRPSQRTGGR